MYQFYFKVTELVTRTHASNVIVIITEILAKKNVNKLTESCLNLC